MPDYRRYRVPGGTYFFTVNLLERKPNDLLVRHIDILRRAVMHTRQRWPFHIDAWVVLPDHIHCVWTLPDGDSDNANRWRVIKQHFSRSLPIIERRSAVRMARGERGIWQRRFWARVIVNDADYAAHVDYCHINPLKHGLVEKVATGLIRPFIDMLSKVFILLIGRVFLKRLLNGHTMLIACNRRYPYCTGQS